MLTMVGSERIGYNYAPLSLTVQKYAHFLGLLEIFMDKKIIITPTDKAMLEYLRAHPLASFAHLAEQLDLSPHYVSQRITSLESGGVLNIIGRTLPSFTGRVARGLSAPTLTPLPARPSPTILLNKASPVGLGSPPPTTNSCVELCKGKEHLARSLNT